MRMFLRFLLLASLCLAVGGPLPAQQPKAKAANPADVYLRGYLIMEDGMKLLQGEDFSGAYYKLKDAKDIFDSVFHSDPNWNPEIVEYRRKRVTELLENARQMEIQRRQKTAANPTTIKPVAPDVPPAALPMPKSSDQMRPTDTVLQSKVSDLQDRIKQLEAKNENVFKELGRKEAELNKLGGQLVDSESDRKRLLERMADANTRLDTANLGQNIEKAAMKKEIEKLKKEQTRLTKSLEEANQQLAESNAKNAELLGQVRDAYQAMKSLNEEKAQLIQERETMNALLGGDGAKTEKVRMLAMENSKLRKSLEELQAHVATLKQEREMEKKDVAATKAAMEKQRAEDQKLISELRGQLDTARTELARIKQENQDYQDQMALLSARLDATERALSQSANPGLTESDAMKENNLLHEIIVKMIKQQAGRERAKKQALEELETTGQMSEQLVTSIREMSEPYQMTPAERALLQAAGMPKLNADGSGINGQMVSPEIHPTEDQAPSTTEAASPDELRGYATAAQRLFSGQQFEEAEAAFERILRLDPLNVGARCNLAVSQVRQGKLDTSIINLKKALAYNYDHDFPHYLLGTVLLRQGKLEEATEEINTALKIKNDNGDGHFALGLIMTKQKRFADAEKEFRQAVQFNPDNGEAHYNLAILYAMSETPKYDLAKNHYRQAISHGVAPDANLDKLLGR